ncbi:glycosyltransferase family 2 protein [Brumimicrobium aurantiacum]|uniref:Glycosyltransferase family 2 protein n=1 Tax=Brumimicrobium aurantiacum TaxID=1737063 RepID=A0A3E1F2B4_9FLAO|nr:glycosyltransferase family A protein [Brumimicrobium aurantiacum]RFC55955.1 glycosyltransferase family 2 protein [Brumimicrobium aurantiacum]
MNKLSLILAITTYNRIEYLKECLDSWNRTRSTNVVWHLVIADDGSNDGTLEYLSQLKLNNCEITVLKNNRIGVHQQVNTILNYLEQIQFDFCFKIDDDISFLKPGWDHLYYDTAINSGNHHLVFCDENWSTEQFLHKPKTSKKHALIGRVPKMHAHGFFYTITPNIIDKVGYMDVASFGYRGMGHVDYTARCAKAGFTDQETPWDALNSNSYITATKHNYKSVIPNTATSVYDSFNRERKEQIILQKNRIYIKRQEVDPGLFPKFEDELIIALTHKMSNFETEKKELVTWYETEIKKITNWHLSQYEYLPKWFLKLGKLFKLKKLK